MTKCAELVWDKAVDKYKAVYAGHMLCQSADPYHVIKLIKTSGCRKAVEADVTDIDTSILKAASISVTGIPKDVPSLGKPYFSINERFDILSDFVDMVINGQSPSLLVTGDPKLGKSWTVESRFKKAGLKSSMDFLNESIETSQPTSAYGDYTVVKGYSSPKSLYRTLYEYRKRKVVLDDCDKAITDPTAILLLKAVTDATEKRIVSWGSEMVGYTDLPKQFEFEGGVIAITNLPMDKIDEAIRGRGNKVDLVMTVDEKLDRIKHVLPHMCEHIPVKERLEVYGFLKENASLCRQLHFGTFISVCNIRHAHPDKWSRLAEYTVTA